MEDIELERTNLMKTMIVENETLYDDESSIIESIEEFEDRLDYLDIEENKKEELKELCTKIKSEEDEKVRETLFKLLQKEVN